MGGASKCRKFVGKLHFLWEEGLVCWSQHLSITPLEIGKLRQKAPDLHPMEGRSLSFWVDSNLLPGDCLRSAGVHLAGDPSLEDGAWLSQESW